MSNLYLWRHAEAEDSADLTYESDLKRALTKKGQREAQVMAEWLIHNLPTDINIFISPARRCQETAAALIKLKQFKCVSTSKDIAPACSVSSLLKCAAWTDLAFALKSADRDKQSRIPVPNVLLISHQPTLGQLAAQLVASEHSFALKKGAVCWLKYREREISSEIIIHSLINPADIASISH